jgi:hypothetical protein
MVLLDGVYEHLNEIAAGVKKKLMMVRVCLLESETGYNRHDLNIPLDLDQARTEYFDPPKVEALFRELEFRTLIQRLIALYPLYGKGQAPKKGQLFSWKLLLLQWM